jgi:hypothetical protein
MCAKSRWGKIFTKDIGSSAPVELSHNSWNKTTEFDRFLGFQRILATSEITDLAFTASRICPAK